MSQKKVEQYKEYKKNKAQILRREKMMRRLELGIIALICAAFLVWFGVSIGQNLTRVNQSAEEAVTATELDLNAYIEYVDSLQSSYTA